MHGAPTLIVERSSVTKKWTKSGQTLLDQFGKPIANYPQARPPLMHSAGCRANSQEHGPAAWRRVLESDAEANVLCRAVLEENHQVAAVA